MKSSLRLFSTNWMSAWSFVMTRPYSSERPAMWASTAWNVRINSLRSAPCNPNVSLRSSNAGFHGVLLPNTPISLSSAIS